uniref:Lysozyme n=1 Tax=Plectus sambesii TaxID=2011161 RepID=A0A914VXW6_9BILA
MRSIFFCLNFMAVFYGLARAADGINGFDTVQSLTVDTIHCLKRNGYSAFIARVYVSSGNFDQVGMQNIKTANAAGLLFVDAYLFPCVDTSCPSGAQQVKSVINEMAAQRLGITRIWLDIEKYQWSGNMQSNQAFIRDMVHQAQNMSMDVGIYTSYSNWQAIVGLDWNEFRILPLWYADYDGHADFSGFRPFGGWDQAEIHQFQANFNGPCGVRMDLDWFP